MTRAILTFVDGGKDADVNLDYDQWLELWRTGKYQGRLVKTLTVNDFSVRFL